MLKRLIGIEDLDTDTYTHLVERADDRGRRQSGERAGERRELVVANLAELERDDPPAKLYRKRSGVTAQYTSVGAERWGSALDMANVVDPDSLDVEDRLINEVDADVRERRWIEFMMICDGETPMRPSPLLDRLDRILEIADRRGTGRPRAFVRWDEGSWHVKDGRWVLAPRPHPARGAVLDLGTWLDARRAALREAA